MPTTEHEETGPRARARRYARRHPVHIRFDEGDGRLLDHHAEALGIPRRQLAVRVIQKYTADAARDIAREQEARAREARERLEGER